MTRRLAPLLVLLLASPAAADDLVLKIEAPRAAIHVGGAPDLKPTIVNQGAKPVALVLPGDGSESKWRTPVVGWSVLSADELAQKHLPEVPVFHGGRCGNINAIKLKEVFTLQPGESRSLGEWAGQPALAAPGRYRVVFYYQNIPDLKITGIPLGEHETGALDKIAHSTPCKLMSNEVVVEVLSKQ